ncbi:hypothetical protein C8A05DRAFT_11980 [Staphylotrichum tortipilum]|uniref:Uncharacterized protein n=1 Tax=Staphylotrichum tortipilum TaxID=2831512 RepID=A0AAN6MVA2_9PEZI|nr:hypothetical protein C8A05DRAFT_11980 [Staphylotrichum longicolle]
MVGSVLPGPLRLRRTAATAAAPKDARQRTAVQRKASGTTAQVATGRSHSTVGSRLDKPQVLPDRREFDLALTQGKGLASMVASTAAALGQPLEGSGLTDNPPFRAGLDLIFNASREYAAHQDADYHADFERSTYVNGVQHVLRGLPRDLEPAEAVMLHRAMPSVLAGESQAPAPGGGNGACEGVFDGKRGTATNGQNAVHILVLLCLCWLSSFAAWIIPRAVAYGHRVVEAEQKHGYIPRLLLAATALLHAVVQLLRYLGEFWPCRVVFLVLEYASQGIRGAVYEFGERAVAREAARRRVTRAA